MTIYLVELAEADDLQSYNLHIIAMPDTFRTILDSGLVKAKEVKTFTLKEAFN